MIHKNTTGSRIRQARGMSGLTRKDFCEKHTISLPSLRAWELDHTNISERFLTMLINVFKKENISVSAHWILEGIGHPPFIYPHKDLITQPLFEEKHTGLFKFFAENNNHAPYINQGDVVRGFKISAFDISKTDSSLVLIKTNKINDITNALKLDDHRILSMPTRSLRVTAEQALIDISSILEVFQIVSIEKMQAFN